MISRCNVGIYSNIYNYKYFFFKIYTFSVPQLLYSGSTVGRKDEDSIPPTELWECFRLELGF